jgi:hypothetical protein
LKKILFNSNHENIKVFALWQRILVLKLTDISRSFLDGIEDKTIRNLIVMLLNTIEEQNQHIESQNTIIQQLRDEINRLKKEQGKPDFGQVSRLGNKNTNHSSEADRKNKRKWSKKDKKNDLIIDSEVQCDLSSEVKAQLPADLRFLRYETVVQQDVRIVRQNTRYRLAIYYSPSQRKTYRAKLPEDHNGYFGSNLQCLAHIFTYQCDVTRSKLLELFTSFGIDISAGSLNNILQRQASMYDHEFKDILRAGLSVGYCGMDSTGSKQKGERLYTQIITNHLFTAFSSRKNKSRQSVLSVLQATDQADIKMIYNTESKQLLNDFGISKPDKASIDRLLEVEKVYSKKEIDHIFTQQLPHFRIKKNMYHRLEEALAMGYYYHQKEYPVVLRLISDDAGEYKKIASILHGLCWVHDGRFYKKLVPKIELHRQLLEEFLNSYWGYYRKLLDYKSNPSKELAHSIDKQFDSIFTTKTDYSQLNKQIERTYANKKKLLAVLKYPQLPLHNNTAELAARKVVIKRNISIHTINDTGTKIRDGAMTIIETAKKLGVNTIDYLHDRISGKNQMTPLCEVIYSNTS